MLNIIKEFNLHLNYNFFQCAFLAALLHLFHQLANTIFDYIRFSNFTT